MAVEVIVRIKEVSSGEVRETFRTYPDDARAQTVKFHWTDGNYGCDCNRHIFFHKSDADDSDIVCSKGRYLVRVEMNGEVIFEDIGF